MHFRVLSSRTFVFFFETFCSILQARIQISFSGGGGGGGGGRGGCFPPKTHSSYYTILWFPDFNGCKPFTRKVNVSSSNHENLFFFFFLIYVCILHNCCAISNQYHFTNPISTFLPKFQGGPEPPPPPPLDPPIFILWFYWCGMPYRQRILVGRLPTLMVQGRKFSSLRVHRTQSSSNSWR